MRTFQTTVHFPALGQSLSDVHRPQEVGWAPGHHWYGFGFARFSFNIHNICRCSNILHWLTMGFEVFLNPGCNIHPRMMPVFNAVLPAGIQCWFSALLLACRDFSRWGYYGLYKSFPSLQLHVEKHNRHFSWTVRLFATLNSLSQSRERRAIVTFPFTPNHRKITFYQLTCFPVESCICEHFTAFPIFSLLFPTWVGMTHSEYVY